MRCCMCNKEMEGTHPFIKEDYLGNNAWPIVEGGRCCDFCDCALVIPQRMGQGAEMGLVLWKSRLQMWLMMAKEYDDADAIEWLKQYEF